MYSKTSPRPNTFMNAYFSGLVRTGKDPLPFENARTVFERWLQNTR